MGCSIHLLRDYFNSSAVSMGRVWVLFLLLQGKSPWWWWWWWLSLQRSPSRNCLFPMDGFRQLFFFFLVPCSELSSWWQALFSSLFMRVRLWSFSEGPKKHRVGCGQGWGLDCDGSSLQLSVMMLRSVRSRSWIQAAKFQTNRKGYKQN